MNYRIHGLTHFFGKTCERFPRIFFGPDKFYWFLSLVSIVIFLSNSTYISYPDEFVNILGGKAIVEGRLPYSEYFDHHMPFAWYLASVLLFLGGGNLITFRILWAIFQFLLLFLLGLWVKKYHNNFLKWYGVLILIIPAYNQYFWLHLFLGDSLASLFFLAIITMLFLETLEASESKIHFYTAPLLVTTLIFSSLSYLYIGLVMLVWTGYLYIRRENLVLRKDSLRKILMNKQTLFLFLAFISPYLLYGLFLIITRSLDDFVFSNFTYNTQHYISIDGFTRSTRFNPLRLAFTLINNFWSAFLPAVSQLADLSFYQPISRLVALSLFVSILLFFRKGVIFGILCVLAISFSAPRSSSLLYAKETDYQIGLYLTFGIFASIFALYVLSKYHANEKTIYKKVTNVIAYIWIGTYLMLSSAFMLFNTYHVWYARYMGTLSPIVSYSPVAEYIDRLIEPGDYYWVGPFEAHNHFFVKEGKLASKYPSLLPQFAESEYLKRDFLSEMEKSKPALIIFKHAMGIFGTPADKFGAFFIEWMRDKYVSCKEQKAPCSQNLRDFDVVGDIYVRKDRMEILNKLK